MRCYDLRFMKRALIIFFSFWLVLQAGLAQAHVAMEDIHRMAHATGEAHHDSHDASSQSDSKAGQASGSDDSELCGVAHCCHSACVLQAGVAGVAVGPAASGPSGYRLLPLRTPPSEIERPKWRLAMPAVASFLT